MQFTQHKKGRTVGLDAIVHFYGCKQQLDNRLSQKSISIHVYDKLEEAEDQLATEALRCIQGSYNTVLQDINYDKAHLAQEKC